MPAGLAGPARRSAAPEPVPRRRAAPAARAPQRRPPAPAVDSVPGAEAPTTRDRLRASFGPAAGQVADVTAPTAGPGRGEPLPGIVPAAAELALGPPGTEPPTTRSRIVARALAPTRPAPAATGAAEPAAVVDLARQRELRRPRQEPEPGAVARVGQPAPVVVLAPRESLARGPPAPVPAEEAAPAPTRRDVAAPGAPRAEPEAAPTAAPGPAADVDAREAAEPSAVAPPPPSPAPPTAEPEAAVAPAEPKPEAAPAPPVVAPAPEAAPPGPPRVIRNPEDEPGFQAMREHTHAAAARTKRHQPAEKGAATAQGASAPDPQKDVESQAAHEQEEDMAGKRPGEFDPAKFKADVKRAVEGMAPPATLEEADEFEASGRAGQATAGIHALVTGGKEASERDIATATAAEPDLEGKEPKTVSPMVNDRSGALSPPVGAAGAMPGIRPPEQIDLSGGPLLIAARMHEANVTEEQLEQSNEPEFTGALEARDEVREHAETAPAAYRVQEERVLAAGRAQAEAVAATQLEGMHTTRVETLGGVLAAKEETKSADQQLRDEVNQSILDIHTRTQDDVQTLLETLDSTVDAIFTAGEKAARDEFEAYVDRKMREYKADRYGGLFGGAKWLKDKIFDLPDEVNAFYEDGRANYLAAMDRVIELIATVVGLLLGAAHLRIQAGREEVRTFVEGLPLSTRRLGEEAAAGLDDRFDQLAADVDAKRDELVDFVARKYVESRDELDTRIEELQEANKGLVSKAIDAVVGVIKTIYELGKLLLRVLLKAAAAIGDILAHPIRFLGNLVGAVKAGLERFVSRIGDHLQKSLLDLLFGELGGTGITMPKRLDFAGILDLVLQVLGLTYQSVRERVVKRFGEEVVLNLEQTADVFTTLVKEGLAGLWPLIRDKLADLEDLVVGKIKTYIVERVVAAGIGYIVALLNPAAAFIKACQGIYQIVMFIVERAKQIAAFVDAVLDSITAIAQGNIGAAVEKIESALAGGLSLAIAFLARLANLGALSEKVRSIIALVRKPITRIVDKIVFGAAQLYRRGVAFVKGKLQPAKEPAERAKEPPPAAEPELDRDVIQPESIVIREPFEVAGQKHVITDDGTEKLTVSSTTATPVSDIGALTALHAQYRALPPRATQTQRTALIGQMIVLLQANPSLIGVAAAQLGDPPNLGAVNRHRSNRGTTFQPVGGRPQFAALWELESEHILSRGAVSDTFEAVGLGPIPAESAEYGFMHTVLIYHGASDIKTQGAAGDAALILSHRADLRGVRERLRQLAWRIDEHGDPVKTDPQAVAERDHIIEELVEMLRDWGAGAVRRTKTAVSTEHAQNGVSRGKAPGSPALPPDATIDLAFDQQLDDIEVLGSARRPTF